MKCLLNPCHGLDVPQQASSLPLLLPLSTAMTSCIHVKSLYCSQQHGKHGN